MSIYSYPLAETTPVTIAAGADFATETTLAAVESAVDGLETLVTATNTKLDTVITHVDGVETLIGSTNTKLDTIITHVDQIEGYVDGIETLVGLTNTKLDTVITGQKPAYASAYVPVIHNFATTGITAGVYTPVIPVLSAKPRSLRYMITNSSGAYIQVAVNSVDFCVVPPSGAVSVDIEVNASTLINVTSDINVSTGKLTISAFV